MTGIVGDMDYFEHFFYEFVFLAAAVIYFILYRLGRNKNEDQAQKM